MWPMCLSHNPFFQATSLIFIIKSWRRAYPKVGDVFLPKYSKPGYFWPFAIFPRTSSNWLFCTELPNSISNFLEEISSLSHSVVFFYSFALIAEEGFLISSCYSLELCIQMDISFFFSFAFSFSFSQLFVSLLRQPFCFFAFLFLGDGLDPYKQGENTTLRMGE